MDGKKELDGDLSDRVLLHQFLIKQLYYQKMNL